MKSVLRLFPIVAVALAFVLFVGFEWRRRADEPPVHAVVVHKAAAYDLSPRLTSLEPGADHTGSPDCEEGCGTSPGDPDAEGERDQDPIPPATPPPVPPEGAAVEQRKQGARAPIPVLASFDGLGVGFDGPHGPSTGRNPSDNSLAVGPNHIVQIVNSRMAVFSKTGKPLYGSVTTNTIFKGFGGPCEDRNNGDAVVRYDQLADRWLIVMPIFNRIIGRDEEPYAMCYALSENTNPMGSYYRYEFRRKLFPDYPRPGVWPDGYYIPSSTGDNVIQKHACVVERAPMMKGKDATEQCVVVDGVNFLNPTDVDGQALPPTGAPNILMAAGGSQLRQILRDDAIYAWQFLVDWKHPEKTKLSDPVRIPVAPYQYLCGGQLTKCVPQPGTETKLDAQGDKLMQRLVYRNFGDHESIVAVHSVNTAAGGGGVRWYEFRLNGKRDPVLYQQSTFAPDSFFRWMASAGMDGAGNIAIGYSFGGTPNFAGQRFSGRMADDPKGQLTFQESVLATGEAAQTNTLRWEDYSTLTMDPTDDCTFWYVGDYYKSGAVAYSTRIGSFRMPGCMTRRVNGLAFFDRNHNQLRDMTEPGFGGLPIAYAGAKKGAITSGANGNYNLILPADPAYQSENYTLTVAESKHPGWLAPVAPIRLRLEDAVSNLDIPAVCTVTNRGGEAPAYWASGRGQAALAGREPEWRALLNGVTGTQSYAELKAWMAAGGGPQELAATMLNVAFGEQDGGATVQDSVRGGWPTVRVVMERAKTGAAAYRDLLQRLNANRVPVTPSEPSACGAY